MEYRILDKTDCIIKGFVIYNCADGSVIGPFPTKQNAIDLIKFFGGTIVEDND